MPLVYIYLHKSLTYYEYPNRFFLSLCEPVCALFAYSNYLCQSVPLFRITIHCENKVNMIVWKVRLTKKAQAEIFLYFY